MYFREKIRKTFSFIFLNFLGFFFVHYLRREKANQIILMKNKFHNGEQKFFCFVFTCALFCHEVGYLGVP